MPEAAIGIFCLIGIFVADALARPIAGWRPLPRSLAGITVLTLAAVMCFGAILLCTGAAALSAGAVLALAAMLTMISNIKFKVLGEPLVFTDFALIGAVFQHPQFYVSALRPWQAGLLISGVAILIAFIVGQSTMDAAARLAGLALMILTGLLLALHARREIWQQLACAPDLSRDVRLHGLAATLLLQWMRWRTLPDPEPCEEPKITGQGKQIVVIVQCESFTDPADLFGDATMTLPGLTAARDLAQLSGNLNVSGFGAYTMRTEYGVLFGRSESELGLRRFDPFLTAHRETSWALPNRLLPDDWVSIFVHPHDLRFYGREELMPAAGFGELIGDRAFATPAPDQGRYVSDAAVTAKILEIADQAASSTLIYAVTIENHGPWAPEMEQGASSNIASYLRLVRRSDAMLLQLCEKLSLIGRPVTLCFFGDHRPSIPVASDPGPARHTPYILVSFNSDGTPCRRGMQTRDLTPAQLHHAILDAIRLREGQAE